MKPKAYHDRMEEIRQESIAVTGPGLESASVPEVTAPAPEPMKPIEVKIAKPDPKWCPRCKAPALKGKEGVPYNCSQCHDKF